MAGNPQSTNDSQIELVNGRIVDGERGIYSAPGTRLVLDGEPRVDLDRIDALAAAVFVDDQLNTTRPACS